MSVDVVVSGDGLSGLQAAHRCPEREFVLRHFWKLGVGPVEGLGAVRLGEDMSLILLLHSSAIPISRRCYL